MIIQSARIFLKQAINIAEEASMDFQDAKMLEWKDAIRIFGNLFIQLKGLGFTSTLETIVKLKLLGCRFNEIPFVLRYDKKASPSKMVSSVTTLGYLTMALLYHWPFGGWRRSYRDLARVYRESPEAAFQRFGCGNAVRSTVCQIGG